MFPKVLVVLTAFAVLANAQSGISECILNCVGKAVTANGCGTITNTACICGSAPLQSDTLACLEANCPSDIASANDLNKAQCAGITPTGSVSSKAASATGGATSTTPGSASSTGSTAPSSSPSSAGSMVDINVVGVVGAIMAGALAL